MKIHLVIGALAALALGGCGLLDTEQPNIIDPGTLNSPAGAEALRTGALADFTFVKDGDGTQCVDGLILIAGLLSDEFVHSTTPPSEQEIDQRSTALINPSLSDVYRNLHKARAGSELAAESLQKYLVDPTATTDIAEMQAIAGFTYLYFGEDFCSGVPFSKVQRGWHRPSACLRPPSEPSTIALAKFDSALAQPGLAVDDGTITNLAPSAGPGRCSTSDQFTDASDAAATCPRISPTTPSTPTARSGCRTPSGRTPTAACGRSPTWRAATACPTSPPRIRGCRWTAWTTTGTASPIRGWT